VEFNFFAASAVASLATCMANRELLREGGLTALIQIVPTNNQPSLIPALDAIYYLSYNEKNKVFLLDRGGVAMLVSLLASKSSNVLVKVAKMLARFTLDGNMCETVKLNGGIQAMLSILLSQNDELLLIYTLDVLSNLAMTDENREVIRHALTTNPNLLPTLINGSSVSLREAAISLASILGFN